MKKQKETIRKTKTKEAAEVVKCLMRDIPGWLLLVTPLGKTRGDCVGDLNRKESIKALKSLLRNIRWEEAMEKNQKSPRRK